MKKEILAIANDIHLQQDNIEQVLDLVRQLINYCLKNDIKDACLAGDVIDSRSSLRMNVLQALLKIARMFKDSEINLHIIPGNHDKTRYDSEDSWLDVMYGDCINIYREYGILTPKDTGITIQMLPFFQDDILIERVERLKKMLVKGEKTILISHFGMEGSVSNEGDHVKSLITKDLFKDYFKVLLGHIHDETQIADNIYHLPAIAQKNFGENNNKGFTILYNDGSHEIKNTNFKTFQNVMVDLDTLTVGKVKKLIKDFENDQNNVKFKIIGSEEKVRAFDKGFVEDLGFKCEKVYDDIEKEDSDIDIENIDLKTSKRKLDDSFEDYCKEKEWNYEQGRKYLE